MKATINGLTYNTETSTEIASDSANCPRNDFNHWEETLYRTSKGNHFIHGSGGPMSKYSESHGNERRGGSKLTPLSKEDALKWCEEHECQDAIDKHFTDMIEEA